MVHSALIQSSSKVDSSGQPCMKTQSTSFRGVERVRGMETSIQEMPCVGVLTPIPLRLGLGRPGPEGLAH